MGTLYRYGCPACGNEAEVSGGQDAGMESETLTILCPACRELIDVLISHQPPGRPEGRFEPRCPRSSRHAVQPWTHPGPCPKCGVTMTQGPLSLFWD